MTNPVTGVSVFDGRVFDRIERRDPRNHMLAARLIADGVSPEPKELLRALPEKKTRPRGVWLDQGQDGACTGFSSAQSMGVSPYKQTQVTNNTGKTFYEWAKENDEWPGEAYDGSSLLGAMTGLLKNGFVTNYTWMTTPEEIAYAIAFSGPVVLGINWYVPMMHPDDDGAVDVGGAIAGGHAILCNGFWTTNGGLRFNLANSWGKNWGINGDCNVSRQGMADLLSAGGEAVTFTKARSNLSNLPV